MARPCAHRCAAFLALMYLLPPLRQPLCGYVQVANQLTWERLLGMAFDAAKGML